MAIGSPIQTGQTFDQPITRDRLIELAHQVIGILEPGQALDAEQIRDGADILGLIVRETDASGKWLWTIEVASHMTLAANTHRYDGNNGLPTDMAEPLTMTFRDAQGNDRPVNIWKAEKYEAIINKLEAGIPDVAYLTEDLDLTRRVLFLWPMVSAVVAGSQVLGDDSNSYKCIAPHTANTVTRPLTGANWPMVWELGGLSPVAWVSGASYVSTEQLRMTYRRPIFNFDNSDDTPDMPISWPRMILYKLAFDLGDLYSVPIEERKMMVEKAKGAFNDLFASTRAKGKDVHNKVLFY